MELHLLWAGSHTAPQGHDFPLHTHHHEWEVVFYRVGLIQAAVGTDIYEAAPGTVVLTPPGTAHAEYALTAYANIYAGIDAPAEHPWPRICEDDAEQSLSHLFRLLVQEWQTQRPERETMLTLLVQQLDLLFRRAASAQHWSIAEKLVADAERYMQEQSHRPLTIGEIAQALGVSPSSLRQYFARQRGISPMEFLQRQRAQHARELLHTSDLTLEAIARLCGYDSASHLSRHLKKITGKRPGALRSALTKVRQE